MGPGARVFLDFLKAAGQSFWQILPLTPTSSFIGDSPYSSDSAFAGNPLIISPDILAEDGYIAPSDLGRMPYFDPSRAFYPEATAFKERLFETVFARHAPKLAQNDAFQRFRREHRHWLDDYCLFKALKHSLGGLMWTRWPRELKRRHPDALAESRENLAARIEKEAFIQFLFFGQWERLKEYAAKRDILVIGDAPIYVTLDSADVWANPGLFKLDEAGEPLFVAGVPPDYFSETGQLWGNPVYDWPVHQEQGFAWWVMRLGHNLRLYDFVRLDHFRGFAGYWEIPAGETTAMNGRWVEAPGKALFAALAGHFPALPIVAEDLGVITPDVRELRDSFGFPGMKVLQFAFGPDIGENPDAPHHHVENCAVYTGTHDNNTALGWFTCDAGDSGRQSLRAYINREMAARDAPWALIRLAYMSVARIAVAPMQDFLELGGLARMNMPSTAKGNWTWRMGEDALTGALAARMRALTLLYGRARD